MNKFAISFAVLALLNQAKSIKVNDFDNESADLFSDEGEL
jgi:hypothetical protein